MLASKGRVMFLRLHSMVLAPCASALLVGIQPSIAASPQQVYEKASPSIVVVEARKHEGGSPSWGSGVVVDPSRVVTACHVVHRRPFVWVKVGPARYKAAFHKATDIERDLCILNVLELHSPAIVRAHETARVGDRVFTLGAPQGLELTLSEGIVSAIREIRSQRYLQITAPISPGSSGGALLDADGRLIGITTFYLIDGQNLNFAAPADWIDEIDARDDARREHIKANSVNDDKWLDRANQLSNEKAWQKLRELCEGWAKDAPNSAWMNTYRYLAWEGIGRDYLSAGLLALGEHDDPMAQHNFAGAADAFRIARSFGEEEAGAWAGLAQAYNLLGRNSEALAAAERAVKLDVDDPGAWTALADVYGDLGRETDELRAREAVTRAAPKWETGWFTLVLSYVRWGRKEDAIQANERLRALDPRHADFLWREHIQRLR